MKHIKTYEALKLVKFSNLDKLVDKIKNKLKDELEEEFSKYLTPETIRLGKNDVNAFLLNPNFGVSITMDFQYRPYKTIANVCNVFKEGGHWKRSAYTKYEKSYFTRDINVIDELSLNDEIEGFVKNYVDKLELKNIAREERLLKRNIKKYNL